MILLLMPFIIIKVTGILKYFKYTNIYYTNFFTSIINEITLSLFILGIVVLIIIYIVKLLYKRNSK